MTRQINAASAALIKRFESCRLAAYRDAVGVWTIGWGSTHGVHAGMTITQAEADQRFLDDLAPAEAAVSRLVTVPLSDNQFAALVSFVFNVGENTFAKSTLLRLINSGDYAAVPEQGRRFVFAKGQRLEGLAKRREAEATLFVTPDKPVAPAAAAPAPAAAAPTTKAKSMNPLSILTGLFGGVAGKLEAAKTVATVAPGVVAGTVSSIPEIPTVVKDIRTLIADVEGGKWADVPNAVEALVAEFGKILGNYGVNLGGLTNMVDVMTEAAVTPGKTIATAA